MKVGYITSSSYSGSTLLTFILNAHPKIGTISEFDVMDQIRTNSDYLCSCGERLRECGFFSSLKNELESRGMEFQLDDMQLMFNLADNERLNRYLSRKLPLLNSSYLEELRDAVLMLIPYFNKKMERAHTRNKLFIETVLKLTNSEVFIDANKEPYRLKHLSKDFDTSAIYIYKNGIAGAFSLYKGTLRTNSSASFESECKKWFIEQITINRCLSDIKGLDVVNVAYSDLCSDTNKEVNKIFDMLGLENIDVSSFYNSEHHIIGNSMRVTSIDTIEERLDWQEKLTSSDIKTYKKILDKYSSMFAKYNEEAVSKLWTEL